MSNAQVRADKLCSPLLHSIPRDPEAERLALAYLDKHAPDLVGMVLGGVL